MTIDLTVRPGCYPYRGSRGQLREALGAGLRLRLGGLLVRADYAFKLDRRPGESAGELHLSIGQAF